MRDRREEIEKAGGRLFLIGTGSPDQAGRFADAWAEGLPVFSDADRKAFAAAGMKRGLLSNLNPRTFLNAFRALRGGFRQTKVEGDPWQQGGVLVVSADGEPRTVLHEEIDGAGGDTLDVDAVVAALGRG